MLADHVVCREGQPLAFAARAISADGYDHSLDAAVLPCAMDTASAFAAEVGPAPCAVADMHKYCQFQLKNDLL